MSKAFSLPAIPAIAMATGLASNATAENATPIVDITTPSPMITNPKTDDKLGYFSKIQAGGISELSNIAKELSVASGAE
jgi:hypothetical protein